MKRINRPTEGGSTNLWNVSFLQRDYPALSQKDVMFMHESNLESVSYLLCCEIYILKRF
jgi:hypothetical protein